MATGQMDQGSSKRQVLDIIGAFSYSDRRKPHGEEIDQGRGSTEDNRGQNEAEFREEGRKGASEKDDNNDNEILESEMRTNQRVLWDLSCVLEPAGGLEHVTIDGLDYISLIRDGIAFHATERGFGFRGYKVLLLNDVAIYLWHVTESMDRDILEGLLPSTRDTKTGARGAIPHYNLGVAKELFKLDVLLPTVTCTSLVKIAECDGADRRKFRCDYEFTTKRVPVTAFRHIVQSLRELYKCTDGEKGTIRLYDCRKEDHVAARLPKSTPVFEDSDTRSGPLKRFTDVKYFSDWPAIKKEITGDRKRRASATNEGVSSQLKKAKREEPTQMEPDLKGLVASTVKLGSRFLFYRM